MSSPRRALSARLSGVVSSARAAWRCALTAWPQVLGGEPALGQLGSELLDEALVHAEVDFLEKPGPGLLGGEEAAGLTQVVRKGHGNPLTRFVGSAPEPTQSS